MKKKPGENARPSDPEIDWMLRFQSGDESGFLEIVKRFEKPLINFCYSYMGDVALAEDVAQDVFVEIYKSARRYRPQAKLSTWIFAIAVHRCLNVKRSRKRLVELTESPAPAESAAIHQELQEALQSLPASQRAAVLLAKFEEMSLEEIAVTLNTSVGGVKQLLHRAKNSLRKRLENV
jgi:RNA polymerase sigma-70 factor (ECF subfamily)